MRRDDRRSPEAQEWRRLYKTQRWLRLRKHQLSQHPLCERCLRMHPRQLRPADVVHHKREHKGNPVLFYEPTNLESLCAHHHDSEAQSDERGAHKQIGQDGWPIHPSHPFNRTA